MAEQNVVDISKNTDLLRCVVVTQFEKIKSINKMLKIIERTFVSEWACQWFATQSRVFQYNRSMEQTDTK